MRRRSANAIRELRGRLDESLFPAAPIGGRSMGWGERLVVVVAILALAVVLQLLRIGPSAALNSIWAEDGPVFLAEALYYGFGHAVGTEYSGYLVLVPRLIAEAATLAPLRDAPAVISILSATLVGLSGLAVWFASAGHIRNPYLRGALAAATVLTTVGGLETIDSAAYVSWYMLFASFWLLLWRPRTQLGAVLAAVFILLTALSNPGVWFFLPLALLRLVAVRDLRDVTILAGFFIGAAIQVRAVAISNYEAVEPAWTSHIWGVLLQRVVDGAALGLRLGGVAWVHLGWPFMLVLAGGGAIGLVVGWRHSTSSGRYLTAVAVPTALAMFVISIYQRAVADPMLWPAGAYNGGAGRYSIVPVLLLLSVALVLVDKHCQRSGKRAVSWPALSAMAVIAVAVASSFYAGDGAARGTPRWGTALDRAAVLCAEEKPLDTPVATSPPGFGIQVPCSLIPDPSDPIAQR